MNSGGLMDVHGSLGAMELARCARSVGTVGQNTILMCLLDARSLSVGVKKECFDDW